MIINIKNAKGISMSRKQNIAFGIQKWLLRHNFCDGKTEGQVDSGIYEELLKEFCNKQPSFDQAKVKDFGTYENYVNNRFEDFKKFCIKKWKKSQ
jgi:hypothetical protein